MVVEREWIQVSPEMAALVGGGALPQRPWPAEPVALSYTLGSVGTPATVHWYAAPSPDALHDGQLLLIVAASAIERLFGVLPEGRESCFHITQQLREIALAIRDCDLPQAAREPYRLGKSIELLCDTLRLIGNGALFRCLVKAICRRRTAVESSMRVR